MALETTQIGCGRDIDDVWARVDEPPDQHELTCPDCQAARASLALLAEATHEIARADADDPTLRTSPTVIDTILSIARAEVRRGKIVPLFEVPGSPDAANLWISEQTIAAAVRQACDDLPGVEARRCHVRTVDPPVPPGVTGPADRPVSVTVDLTLSVVATAAIPTLAAAVRTQVIEALATKVGITATAVDIVVEDIHHGL